MVLNLEKELKEKAQKIENFLGVHNDLRRYEVMKMRMAQVIELYKSGSVEQIRDYLKLRKCESEPLDE